MIAALELQKICDFFELGVITKHEYLGLWGNHNYFVHTNQGEFVLKILEENKHDLDQVHSEIAYIEAANKHGVGAPRYHRNQNGSYLYSQNGTHSQVRTKIAGSVLSKANATTTHLCKIGSMLGSLHKSSPHSSLPDRSCWLNLEPVQQLRQKVRCHPSKSAVQLASHPILDIDWSKLPQGLIHGDCWCSNVIVAPNQSVSLIDWEESSYGPAILDLGRTMFGLVEEGLLSQSGFQALLSGYESKRTLSPAEKEHLTLAMKYTGLVITLWRLHRFHDSDKPYTINQSSWHRLDIENWQIPQNLETYSFTDEDYSRRFNINSVI